MRKLLLIAALFAFAPCLHAQSVCPNPGSTGSAGGVSWSCGPANVITGTCQNTALGKYASAPLTNLPSEPQPCMDVYYNTSDGATNHNPTFVISGTAGNVGMTLDGAIDWSSTMAATNGTAPNITYCLVLGTCSVVGAQPHQHWNVVTVATTLMAWGQVNGALSAGATSAQIYVGGLLDGGQKNDFWPNATGYNIYIGNQLVGPITSQTGTWGSGGTGQLTIGWTTGLGTGTASGINAWPVGTDGSGSPSATCTGQLAMVCDIANAMTYLATNSYPHAGSPTVPGNGQFYYFGISGGGTTGLKLMSSGKALVLALNPSAYVGWTLLGLDSISPDPAYGYSAFAQSIVASPNQLSPCGNIAVWNQPINDAIWPQTGPVIYTVSPAAASVSTIAIGPPYAVTGMPVTGANAAYNMDSGYSGQGIFANMGYVPVNSDGYIGRPHLDIGQVDNQNPCMPQVNFGATVPGASYRVEAGEGHAAAIKVQTGGCSVAADVCPNSVSIQDLFGQLQNMFVSGNHSDAGFVGAGFN